MIDAQDFKLIWRQQVITIGENRPFWLLYALGEYHKEWVPLSRLASLTDAPYSADSLKQTVYHLRKKHLGSNPWDQVARAIKAKKKAYRLNFAPGVRLIP